LCCRTAAYYLAHGDGIFEIGIQQLTEHSSRCKLLQPAGENMANSITVVVIVLYAR
jgi:hypothetical protein